MPLVFWGLREKQLDKGNFSSSDYLVDAGICQIVLLVIGITCLVGFVVSLFVEHTTKWMPER